VNAVAELQTGLNPAALLAYLLEIEATHKRVRSVRDGPRTLDLDILLFNDECVNEPLLTIPHPRMHERAFVLWPLAEIAPELKIPGRGHVLELLVGLDVSGVRKFEEGAR